MRPFSGSDPPASPIRAPKDLPDPVSVFEAGVPVGVAPFEVTSFQAFLIREGSARIEGNFDPFTVVAGDLVLMRPGTRCGSVSTVPVDMVTMRVHPTFLVDQVRWTRPVEQRARHAMYETLLRDIRRPVLIRLSEDKFMTVAELYAQLVFLSNRPSALRRMIARATELIWEIEELLDSPLHRMPWERRDPQASLPTRPEVQKALRAIREHYASDLSFRDLDRDVALSESALRRAVLAATGFTPREYLHRIRLMRFEQLVSETAIPLAEAARLAGWSSPSHARAAFAQSHGMSPSEFRTEAQDARRADWLRGFDA